MKNCLIAQSGGPTVAINASLAGAIQAVKKSSKYNKIYGLLNGITGIFDNRYLDLGSIFDDEEKLEQLKITPAMYLGSCRYKLPSYREDKSVYEIIFTFFEKNEIEVFFYIGGNDSMDTVVKLSQYAESIGSNIKIIGIPKTIDNDLTGIDHTPGFGSAAKYVASSMLEISHDTMIYAVKSVTIVEVMGRDAGWLTAATALARNVYNTAPHLIYLPEVPFDKEAFMGDVEDLLEKQNNVIVAVSEGIRDASGKYISASEEVTDIFGHKQLSGAGKALEILVKQRLGVKARSVEVNVLQRCAAHLASLTDIEEAYELGKQALHQAEEGKTAIMVNLKRQQENPYQVTYGYVPICDVANSEKRVPLEWINEKHNNITDEMMTYLKPLICGEVSVPFGKGLPVYMNVKHLIDKKM